MRVPFGAITLTDRGRELVNEALDTGRVSSGKMVRELEDRFARMTGTSCAVALSTGTDADALALAVLHDYGATRDDEVIIPSLSFVATGNAVLQAGFKPVFVDIQRETLNIDPGKIEQAITDRTVAIMPVHLMGKPAEMDTILDIAQRHNLKVIEDAAEAHGAIYRGRNIGTLGDMAAYSLYVAHIITSVEGGMVTTDNEEYAAVLRSLRSHGRACKCRQCIINVADQTCPRRFQNGKDIRFQFERIGFSAKMNELEAAIGLGSMEVVEETLEKRHDNLLTMIERIHSDCGPYLTTFQEEPHEKIGPHALPILVTADAPFDRDELVSWLEKHDVDSRNLFASMPTQCPGFAYLGHELGQFPEAEYCADYGLHVGVHQELSSEQIDYLFQTLQAFLKSKGA
jgi:dTDP-4-amino-4,6-dideoxygalactose transaminase